jgi:hypothetical protein
VLAVFELNIRAAFQPGYPDLVANIPLLTDVAQ